jgi:hypothetical protein
MTEPGTKPRVLVISASDTKFMPFLRGLIASIADRLAAPEVSFACMDLGLSADDKAWLEAQDCLVTPPRAHLGVKQEDHSPALRSFLARPFLREYFPGYDVYLWIDSDVWLQDPLVFQDYVDGALARGMAITHERERAYRFQAWLLAWTGKHMLLGYGPFHTTHLLLRRHLNAGFFAIRSDAPHWDAWARRYQAAIQRTGSLVPHDQFALNQAIYGDVVGRGGLDTTFLDPRCNWICDRGIPMWNDTAAAFCKPISPYEPIGALHLAGPAKRTLYEIKRTGGGSFHTYILRGASPSAPCTTEPLAVQP